MAMFAIMVGCQSERLVPEYGMYIAAWVNGQKATYLQTDQALANTYSTSSESTWMEVGKYNTDFWGITFYETDLDSLRQQLPFTFPLGSKSTKQFWIRWIDQSIKPITDAHCEGADADCIYSANESDDFTITVTEISGNIISGTFSGTLHLLGVG